MRFCVHLAGGRLHSVCCSCQCQRPKCPLVFLLSSAPWSLGFPKSPKWGLSPAVLLAGSPFPCRNPDVVVGSVPGAGVENCSSLGCWALDSGRHSLQGDLVARGSGYVLQGMFPFPEESSWELSGIFCGIWWSCWKKDPQRAPPRLPPEDPAFKLAMFLIKENL